MPKKLPTNEESINKRINYLVNYIREQELSIGTIDYDIAILEADQLKEENANCPGCHRSRIKELKHQRLEKMSSITATSREIRQLMDMRDQLQYPYLWRKRQARKEKARKEKVGN